MNENNNEKFDLILMDDMMPKMRGTEVFSRLKQIKGFNTPVVALTANALSGMRESYLKAGFDDYLAKPIEKKELIRVVKSKEGEVSVDLTGKKSGRGAYICKDIECLEKAFYFSGQSSARCLLTQSPKEPSPIAFFSFSASPLSLRALKLKI